MARTTGARPLRHPPFTPTAGAALAALLAALAGPAARAADEPAPTLVEAPQAAWLAQDLLVTAEAARKKQLEVTVVVVPKPKVKLEAVSVPRVKLGDKLTAPLTSGFQAQLKTSDTLIVAVKLDVVRKPGTYGVTVRLRGTVGADGAGGQPPPTAITQDLELSLTLVPAKLRALPPVVIASSRWPLSSGASLSTTLRLVETSGQTALTDLRVEQADPTTFGDVEIDPRLVAEELPAAAILPAGEPLTVKLAASDGFPVGTSRGKMEISAPQLAEAVVVPFEVRMRIHDFLIIPLFAVFGLAGWLVRSKLKDAIARSELLVALRPLLQRAHRQRKAHPDEKQRADVGAKIEAAEDAARTGTSTAIKTAVDELRAEVEKAEASRVAWLGEQLATAAELERVLAARRQLPTGIDLGSPRAKLADVRGRVVANDPPGVKLAWEQTFESLNAVEQTTAAWITKTAAAVGELDPQQKRPPLPATAWAVATPALAALASALQTTAPWSVAEPAKIAGRLQQVADAHAALLDLGRRIGELFQREAKRAVDAYAAAGKPDKELEEAARLPPRADGGADDGVAELERVLVAARAFVDLLRSRLRSKLALAKLDEGKYAEAVSEQLAEDTPGSNSRRISAVDMAPVGDEAPAAAGSAPDREPGPGRTDVVLVQPPPIDGLLDDAAVELSRLQWIRGGVSAVLLAVLAWAVYRGSWTGTFQDVSGLAVFAFFSDFTLDAALDAAAKLKKPAPAPSI